MFQFATQHAHADPARLAGVPILTLEYVVDLLGKDRDTWSSDDTIKKRGSATRLPTVNYVVTRSDLRDNKKKGSGEEHQLAAKKP